MKRSWSCYFYMTASPSFSIIQYLYFLLLILLLVPFYVFNILLV